MILYSLLCEKCGVVEDDFAPAGGPYPVCPNCQGDRSKVFRPPMVIIPPWMTDAGISCNNKHREWLKSDEAKKMNLERNTNEVAPPPREPVLEPVEL